MDTIHCKWSGCWHEIGLTDKTLLKIHLKAHIQSATSIGEGKVVCAWHGCRAEAMVRENLLRHIYEIHAKAVLVKPKCGGCAKEFTREESLRRHVSLKRCRGHKVGFPPESH